MATPLLDDLSARLARVRGILSIAQGNTRALVRAERELVREIARVERLRAMPRTPRAVSASEPERPRAKGRSRRSPERGMDKRTPGSPSTG